MKNIKNIFKNNESVLIIIAFLIIGLILVLFTNFDNSFIKESNLYISEIMTKNTYTLKDNFNEYSDYIEIYNGYKKDINLSGYHLSDSEFETGKWTFPEIIINPGEYLIIYATGKDMCDMKEKICHTNFKLSSKGEVLTLSDNNGNIINKFTYPALANDIAFGYIKNKYTILDNPSPLKENSKSQEFINITNEDLSINEYMIKNKGQSYDSLGYYLDFVELYNSSSNDLLLHNVYLSDDENNLTKYKLPAVEIKKNNYLLIYLSGESKIVDNQIYANFKLSSDDKKLIISNGKKIIDAVEIVDLIENVSYGKVDGKWYYFTKSTPGSENNTFPLEKIDGRKKN